MPAPGRGLHRADSKDSTSRIPLHGRQPTAPSGDARHSLRNQLRRPDLCPDQGHSIAIACTPTAVSAQPITISCGGVATAERACTCPSSLAERAGHRAVGRRVSPRRRAGRHRPTFTAVDDLGPRPLHRFALIYVGMPLVDNLDLEALGDAAATRKPVGVSADRGPTAHPRHRVADHPDRHVLATTTGRSSLNTGILATSSDKDRYHGRIGERSTGDEA